MISVVRAVTNTSEEENNTLRAFLEEKSNFPSNIFYYIDLEAYRFPLRSIWWNIDWNSLVNFNYNK